MEEVVSMKKVHFLSSRFNNVPKPQPNPWSWSNTQTSIRALVEANLYLLDDGSLNPNLPI